VAHDDNEIVQRFLALNNEIVAGVRQYDPFGAQVNTDTPMLPMPD